MTLKRLTHGTTNEMSLFQAQFDEAVWAIISKIPSGQVMAYGEVARAAGFPRHSRMVSRAMSRSVKKLPWHRVVRSDRSLAFPLESIEFETQKARLTSEGAVVLNGKVTTVKPDTSDDLDELIWGPD